MLLLPDRFNEFSIEGGNTLDEKNPLLKNLFATKLFKRKIFLLGCLEALNENMRLWKVGKPEF